MPPAPLGLPRHTWAAVAALLVAAAGGWFALPVGLPRDLGVLAVSACVVVALVVGTVRLRPQPALAWWALAGAQLLSLLAWSFWGIGPHVLEEALPSPNLGDALFVGSYVTSIVVVAQLARTSRVDSSSLIDSAILGTSFGVLMWVMVAAPQATAPGVSVAARLTTAAYPMLDVLLLAAAVPLVMARGRSPRALMLVGWVALQLGGDIVYGRQVVAGEFAMGTPVFAWWLLSYALLAGAALHPSGIATAGTTWWWRRAVLVLGLLPLPGLLLVRVVQGSADNVALIGAATVVVTLLAVGRAAHGDGTLGPVAERAVRRSLVRLAAAVVVFALLPLGALTALAVDESRRAVDEEIAGRLKTSASTGATHVAEQLAVLQDLVASYADRPTLKQGAAAGGDQGLAAVQSHLRELHGRGGAFTAVWFVDASGVMRTLAPHEPTVIGRDFSQRDYFTGVVRTGRPYVSEAFATALPGEPQVVAVAAPVTQDGRFLGLIGAGYRLDALRAFVGRLGAAQDVDVTMTDRRGTAIAGDAVVPGALTSMSDRPGIAPALSGATGLLRPPARDRGAWTAYAPVHAVGWAVTAQTPAEQAYAGLNQLTGRLVAAATLLGQALLVGLLLSVQVERRRRAADALLAAQEEQVREILEAAGDAFIALDTSGRVLRWNRRAEEMFLLPAERALGRPLADLVIPEEDRAAHLDGIARAAEPTGGVHRTVEVVALRADGERFPAEATIWSTVVDGELTFNAFVRDVTERNQHLAELAVARDEALRASRMKSEFVANMSHEIRTPMNGVVGMTTLLLDTTLDDRQRGFVQTLRASADALLGVINDVLDFSKIEAGKLDIECTDFALPLLVEDVVDLLAASAQAKDLEIAAVVDPALPRGLRGDSHRLRQVLINLVGNAVKFTERGEVVLDVRLDGAVEDGRVPVLLAVRDTGAGIPEDRQQRLFDAFTQADTSTTRRHGGTGLGLTISRQLVRLMGGELTVESAPGRGSTFSVRLVLDLAEELPVELAADLSGMRVLVADDSATNRTVLEHLLQRWSAEVTCVGDGMSALSALREAARTQRPFDIALLDVRMPRLDGVEVAEQVERDRLLHGLPVVLLSSCDESAEAAAPGVSARLTKPVREGHLQRVLLELGHPDRPAPLPIPAQRSGGTRGRILVAEDNAVNQVVVVEMLRMIGFEADVADDGAAAVEMLQAGDYDLVLMDCQMPVLDGFAATVRLRGLPSAKARTPVVALTASALVSDQEMCRAAGMDRFLSKPLRLEELDQVLTELLEGVAAR